jgi:hypothetical protein
MARAETAPEEAMAVVGRMRAAGYDGALQDLVEGAFKFGSLDYCERLGERLAEVEDHPSRHMAPNDVYFFLKRTVFGLDAIHNHQLALDRLKNFRALGFTLPQGVLSNLVIPHMLDLDAELPSHTVSRLTDQLPGVFSYSDVANSMLQCLLNLEKEQHMKAAINYLLNGIKPNFLLPLAWSQSLVRSYLATGLKEELLTGLWYVSRPNVAADCRTPPGEVFTGLTCLPRVLHRYETDQDVEEQLRQVLVLLEEAGLGVPGPVGEQLGQQEPGLRPLVARAVAVWEAGPAHWTQDREAAFLAARRALHLSGAEEPHRTMRQQSVQEMETVHAQHAAINRTNYGVVAGLLQAYADGDQPDKALELLRGVQEYSGFKLSTSCLDRMVQSLVRAGQAERAADLLTSFIGTNTSAFASTFLDQLLVGLAREGRHEQVLELLASITPDQLVSARNSNGHHLIAEYSGPQQEAVLAALVAGRWARPTDRRLQQGRLQALLQGEDMDAVMEEVERLVREHGSIPMKQDVTKRLIELEDQDNIQRLIDLSLKRFGEERSLYELIHCFLDTGRRLPARKLMGTPGLRWNQDMVAVMVGKLREAGRLEELGYLVQDSKAIQGCDRDFMFQQLVAAVEGDAARVEEVWLEVQEEGHVPSVALLAARARVLEAAGRPVPFEVPEGRSYPSVEEVTAPITTEGRGTVQRQHTTSKHAVETDFADEIIAAIDGNDFAMATTLIESGLTDRTLGSKTVKVLTHLAQADLAAAARATAFAQNMLASKGHQLNPTGIQKSCSIVMTMIAKENGIEACRAFFDTLSEEQHKFFLSHLQTCSKVAKLFHDEAAYLALVEADPEGRQLATWVLPTGLLAEARPSLLAGLEALAGAGHVAASMALCKAVLRGGDREAARRHWGKVRGRHAPLAPYMTGKDRGQLADILGEQISWD